MKLKEQLDWLESMRHDSTYAAEDLTIEFAVKLSQAMARSDISAARLAKRMSVSPSYISRVLGGEENLSIKSMARFAFALDDRVEISIGPKSHRGMWTFVAPRSPSSLSSVTPGVTTVNAKKVTGEPTPRLQNVA